jgi:hypothetical protein
VPVTCLPEEDRAGISAGLDLVGQAHDVADQIGVALGLLRAQDDDRGLASIEPQPNADRRQPSRFELRLDRVVDEPAHAGRRCRSRPRRVRRGIVEPLCEECYQRARERWPASSPRRQGRTAGTVSAR